MNDKEEKYDQFQNWLAHMGDFLDELRAHKLVTDAKGGLDFSIDSLDAVETLILKRFPSFEDVKLSEAARCADCSHTLEKLVEHGPSTLKMRRWRIMENPSLKALVQRRKQPHVR